MPCGNQRSASCTNGSLPAAFEPGSRGAAMRSGGRCAAPKGIATVKVVPWSTALSTVTVPPCSLTSSWTSASPIPVPSWVRDRAPGTR